jgi:hypothetical protein
MDCISTGCALRPANLDPMAHFAVIEVSGNALSFGVSMGHGRAARVASFMPWLADPSPRSRTS